MEGRDHVTSFLSGGGGRVRGGGVGGGGRVEGGTLIEGFSLVNGEPIGALLHNDVIYHHDKY